MTELVFNDVSFTYASVDPHTNATPRLVVSHLSATIAAGEFVMLVGATGSGKSTLLRLAKPELTPAGTRTGAVYVGGKEVRELTTEVSARTVALVPQAADTTLVTHTPAHELVLGLELLGVAKDEARLRMAEISALLGMDAWLHQPISELSVGKRHRVALAAALVVRPQLILLDEPTATLDPIAVRDFIELLARVHRVLSTTIVVATHDPLVCSAVADRAFVLQDGRLTEVAVDTLTRTEPAPRPRHQPLDRTAAPVVAARNLWLTPAPSRPWVFEGLDLSVSRGEVRVLVGANGVGKSTLLSVLAGVLKPQRGRITNTLLARQAWLPQDPRDLLACETVEAELCEWMPAQWGSDEQLHAALAPVDLDGQRASHPHDLSVGQRQLLALTKLLLLEPELLLIDEPTSGLDDAARELVVQCLSEARDKGTTLIIATHDMGLATALADTASLLFDGRIALTATPAELLERSWVLGGLSASGHWRFSQQEKCDE